MSDQPKPETLEQMLIRHEGMRLKPYHCPAGKLTIGVGRNLDDNGITEEEAMVLLENDIDNSHRSLLKVIGPEFYIAPDDARWAALLDMLFNLGETRFRQFKKLIAAVKAQDWFAAAQAMQDSKWAEQVGPRAVELVWMMRNGKAWEGK